MGYRFGNGVRFAAPRPGRRKAPKLAGPAVDEAEVEVGKAHQPVAALRLGNPDRLADQRLADIDQLAPELDLAVRAHPTHGLFGRIDRIGDPLRIATPALAPQPGWRHLAERFVRALLVVTPAEDVKARLLRRRIRRRRRRRLR